MAHQAGAYPGFHGMKRLGVFILPPGWDASPSQGYPQHFSGTHLYTWVVRGTMGVKCLAQEHNTMKQFINLFFRNLGLDYQQTFRLKPSVFISEVCHVIVHYHVTNVEERRRGPGPKCETERTGAPPFCSGLGPPPFPITLLLFPSFANLVHYLGS